MGQQHDNYGKRVLQNAAGEAFQQYGPSVEIQYGAGGPARIDGMAAGRVAVDVESGTGKQVRGTVLDLIYHPFGKKLLLILPVHVHNPEATATQCENILRSFLSPRTSESSGSAAMVQGQTSGMT